MKHTHRAGRTRTRSRPIAARLAGAVAVLALAATAGCRSPMSATEVVGPYFVMRTVTPPTDAQLLAGAEQAWRQLLAGAAARGALDVDARAAKRVRDVVARLADAGGSLRADAAGRAWEAHVIGGAWQAWALPGGRIAVGERLLAALAPSDDELAALLAHVMAHALREHPRERAAEQADRRLSTTAPVEAFGVPIEGDAARTAVHVAAALPGSRAHEIEADRLGVEMAARAGYDPHAAAALWARLAGAGAAASDWARLHPAPAGRLRDLHAYAQRAMPLYEVARPR